MKTLIRLTRRFEFKSPGYTMVYPAGTDVRVGTSDILDESGLHICLGHGLYNMIPRDAFEIITIHSETVTIETLVNEDGQFIETRRV